MVCIMSVGNISVVVVDCSSFLVLVVSDHFSNDPAVTAIIATEHQLVLLYRSVCAEKRAQILEPLMSSKFCRCAIQVCSLVCVHRLLDCSQD